MCGIIGYIGNQNSTSILLNALHKMEYRGYDSAGIACYKNNKTLKIIKDKGKINHLKELFKQESKINSQAGIGHTRWATHGEVSKKNAHPHTDFKKKIAVVHNGIIENFQSLKTKLLEKGYIFESETDTEVLAHLIDDNYDGDLEKAVRNSLSQITGPYGLIVYSVYEPDKLIAARYGSPLIIGKGKNENLIASDVSAIIHHTQDVVYLEDQEIASINKDNFLIKTLDNRVVNKLLSKVNWQITDVSKNGYESYMIKEIYEQSQSFKNAIRGRLVKSEGNVILSALKNIQKFLSKVHRIIITAMGSSFHASIIGKYLIEEMAKIPVEVEYSAEFRYRGPIIDSKTLVIVISQSGETADTLGALREAKLKGAQVLSLCNVVGSSISRESHGGCYLHAGPEIGVASTKVFVSQITILTLISLYMGRLKYLSLEKGQNIVKNIEAMPELIQKVIDFTYKPIKNIAKKFSNIKNALYLGRGYGFPIALEGALKLKEISYIHAEGYHASEMKHGPIALIDENMLVIVIALKGNLYDKIISNLEEVKVRKAKIIAIATEGDKTIKDKVDYVIYIPEVENYLTPILSVIPLQFFAYFIASIKGCDIDQPRNLAKSVTVE